MSRGKVRSIDHGYDRLLRAVEQLRKARVTVGIHADKGAQMHRVAAHAAGEVVPVSVVDVATWNEFGMGVPERPFLRGWFDATTTKNMATMRVLAQSVLKGTRTLDQALELMGARLVGELQQRIASGEGVKGNAASTIARKGSSTPLVDFGQLRQSCTYTVRIGG